MPCKNWHVNSMCNNHNDIHISVRITVLVTEQEREAGVTEKGTQEPHCEELHMPKPSPNITVEF